jgi:hypothetical protein
MDILRNEVAGLTAFRHKSSKLNVFDDGDGAASLEISDNWAILDAKEVKVLYKTLKKIIKDNN